MTELHLKKLKGRVSGYKPIKKTAKKKTKVKKGYFNPDAVKDNWVFDVNDKQY